LSVSYAENVFINCPFSDDYKPFFDALVFTIHYCQFVPRCSLEYNDSDDVRIDKIAKLIQDCQYGIHDLSLAEPRFNMPLELGIFIGCRRFGSGQQKRKKYLILERESHSTQKLISDLSGQDVKAHQNEPRQLIRCVRDWLAGKTSRNLPHGTPLSEKYQCFREQLPAMCAAVEWVEAELAFLEYSELVTTWLNAVNPDPDSAYLSARP